MIYLDHNATTPLAPEAAAAMRPHLEAIFGNPSSIHAAGRAARAAIDDARDRIAALLGAKPHEIVFTGGGTESDNLAVFGIARHSAPRGRHLVTCAAEHHAVLHAFDALEREEGFRVTRLPVDRSGRVDPGELAAALGPGTTLVSVMSANNETGVIQPIDEIAAACRRAGALFHSDMIQSFGKSEVRARPDGPDAFSLAAHKFYGPKGAGLLWLRSGLGLRPMFRGGSHENERRPGTENAAAIAGMAAAAESAARDARAESERLAPLRDRLRDGIRAIFPDCRFNGSGAPALANTLSATFPGLDAETLLINLDLEGVCASSGSACMVGSVVPSHVLRAMGLPDELARATVRFSLGRSNDAPQIDAALAALRRIAARLAP